MPLGRCLPGSDGVCSQSANKPRRNCFFCIFTSVMKARKCFSHRRRTGRRSLPRAARNWILFWLALAVVAIACSHRIRPVEPPPPVNGMPVVACGGLELPALAESDTVIYNAEGRYTFLYAPSCKVSRWVAYKLTRSDVSGEASRSDAFREDALLEMYGWPSATHADYKGSGYDRGHLLPSADRTSSAAANRATFLYSNMAPQLPKLNRGAWKLLEEHLRKQSADYDTLYIVVGALLDDELPTIGSGVAVPALFFKAVVLREADAFTGEAYVMPNDAERLAGHGYADFEVTMDSVERLTGLDLFPAIEGF